MKHLTTLSTHFRIYHKFAAETRTFQDRNMHICVKERGGTASYVIWDETRGSIIGLLKYGLSFTLSIICSSSKTVLASSVVQQRHLLYYLGQVYYTLFKFLIEF